MANNDVRGTWKDWPTLVLVVAGVLLVLIVGSGNAPTLAWWALALFGVVSLLIRRGAFSPRRD
jgi:hypothetical protein